MHLKKAISAVLLAALLDGSHAAQPDRVFIHVDAAKLKSEMRPVWSFFGYDEPNYTYMKDGKKLLSELAALNEVGISTTTQWLYPKAVEGTELRRRITGREGWLAPALFSMLQPSVQKTERGQATLPDL